MNFHLFFAGVPAVLYVPSALLIAYGVAVIAMTMAILVGTRRPRTTGTHDVTDAEPRGASVVIPFRNEEHNLNALLVSIDRQNYGGMIEVVLVNDSSTDGGAGVIKKFVPRNKNLSVNVVDLDTLIIDTNTRLTSKQQALDLGVDTSSHRLILFTDADMILAPTWVESMVNSHLSTGADMVFGHTAIIKNLDFIGTGIVGIGTDTNSIDTDIGTHKNGLVNRLFTLLESYQLEYLFSFARAFSKLNLTGSCMGNNVLVTKEAYAACGGQRGVGYTIVEDRALLGLVRKRGFKTAAQEPFTVTAWTYPSQSKRQFANQMLRWARGGLRPGDGLFIAGLLLLTQNILFLFSIMGILPLIPALQSAANFILSWAFLSISFHKNGTPVSKILYPAYYIFMMAETALFLPLMLFGRGIRWKDRKV